MLSCSLGLTLRFQGISDMCPLERDCRVPSAENVKWEWPIFLPRSRESPAEKCEWVCFNFIRLYIMLTILYCLLCFPNSLFFRRMHHKQDRQIDYSAWGVLIKKKSIYCNLISIIITFFLKLLEIK